MGVGVVVLVLLEFIGGIYIRELIWDDGKVKILYLYENCGWYF